MDKIMNAQGALLDNIGLLDRTIRFFAGGVLMAYGIIGAIMTVRYWVSGVSILLANYLLMTFIVGWDPFYEIFGAKTCNLDGGRNQCGTLP